MYTVLATIIVVERMDNTQTIIISLAKCVVPSLLKKVYTSVGISILRLTISSYRFLDQKEHRKSSSYNWGSISFRLLSVCDFQKIVIVIKKLNTAKISFNNNILGNLFLRKKSQVKPFLLRWLWWCLISKECV